MNFTGVYNYEPFARNRQFVWLDCQHLNGTECYCDEEGASALQRMIADYSPQGIHFITRVRDKDCVKNRVKRAKIVRFTLC